MARLLIVGGGGFIGTHTCLTLLNFNHKLVIVDNFSNSSPIALERVKDLALLEKNNKNFEIKKGDIRDEKFLESIFKHYANLGNPIKAVIHFAGLKSVKQSIKNPLLYWDTNVIGTHTLVKVMEKNNCKTLVFSSSATIYGSQNKIPIPENAPIRPINPYGRTKAAIEKLLLDIACCKDNNDVILKSNTGWRIARLRYFNPVGAHPSGEIGESPLGIPNNLFPYITQVAIGKRNLLQIFGDNWPTKDGTGIRDYIHVMDLAEGHCSALEFLLNSEPILLTLNLGTGRGTSVFEVINTFKNITNKNIPYEICDKRDGDSAIAIADVSMAKKYLSWESKRDLRKMCMDSWNWQSSNINGY